MNTRYLIQMTLTADSWLHIGDGGTREVARRGKSGKAETVDIHTVARDGKNVSYAKGSDLMGQPYLPATAIKGPLRARFEELFGPNETECVFGGKDGAGCLEFADAFLTGQFKIRERASVAIARNTRTALHQHLAHMDVVDPDAAFVFELVTRRDVEAALPKLMTMLKELETGQIAIGAGVRDGWGRLRASAPTVTALDADGVRKWIDGGCVESGVQIFKEHGKAVQDLPAAEPTALTNKKLSVIEVSLSFDGPFLVNDPSLEFKDGEVNLRLLRDSSNERGKPYLPASSFRGVLRAQAERILRTLYGSPAACSMAAPCAPLVSVDDLNLTMRPLFPDGAGKPFCPACRVFGATGWASCLTVSDFKSPPGAVAPERIQDFVAIDRFTQGAAHKKKFDAERAEAPTFTGNLCLDHKRLTAAKVGSWGVGLVALALRDLASGDGAFGFGRSKGYGRATAPVINWDTLADAAELKKQVLSLNALEPTAAKKETA